MTTDFDKEMDAILRRARNGEAVFAAGGAAHLEADEIAAFAENALPEKAKTRATSHFADCDRCRTILSNLIRLVPAEESEIVHAGEKTIVAAPIPWYRRLFQFPNLAYSLGAVTILFAGLIGFMTLRSFDSASNSEVSQVSEKTLETKSAPSAPTADFSANSTANANTTAGSASNANAALPAPAGTPPAGETAGADSANPNQAPKTVNEPAASTEEQPRDDNPAVAKTVTENEFQTDGASAAQKPQDKPAETKEQNKREEDAPKNDAADSKLARNDRNDRQDVTSMSPSALGAAKKSRAATEKQENAAEAKGETTSAGGRSFRRSENVWYDTAYNNQPTTNVTRGTGEYKKLDAGLRVIAENLGGTVVVVWKGKAYRIR